MCLTMLCGGPSPFSFSHISRLLIPLFYENGTIPPSQPFGLSETVLNCKCSAPPEWPGEHLSDLLIKSATPNICSPYIYIYPYISLHLKLCVCVYAHADVCVRNTCVSFMSQGADTYLSISVMKSGTSILIFINQVSGSSALSFSLPPLFVLSLNPDSLPSLLSLAVYTGNRGWKAQRFFSLSQVNK